MQKFDPAKDPFLKREREKYATPVVSREYILDCLTAINSPVAFQELMACFGYQNGYGRRFFGVSICWVASETGAQFTIFNQSTF